jgi:hypothetical protein
MSLTRKRSHTEANGEAKLSVAEPSLLQRIRNMWQFANLCQWIFLFGSIVKVDDNFDVEDLEAECLKPHSTALQDIGFSLLKYLSSHRGLTPDLFDEYTRRQYVSKVPEMENPFGTEESPARFADFDVFKKIRVLQQMTQFIMMNPEKLRDRAAELGYDSDQTTWRIEPYGWDRQDNTYFVLDDNRIYRLSDPPLPPAKPKKNSQKARAAERAAKRRRIAAALDSDDAVEAGEDTAEDPKAEATPVDDGLGGMIWECIAVSLDEVRDFVGSIQKSKDPNEKVLRNELQDHLVPILEKQEESRRRKIQQREKELLALEKMAYAKRSSRIANKIEQDKANELAREEEQKRREAEAAARKEEQRRIKMERERDNRLMSREERLREREVRRIQHEEELARLSEDNKTPDIVMPGRLSQRHREAEIEKKKQALKELEEEDDDEWTFDCICGVHGKVDDGSHSVACEKCNIWQHSKCLGIDEEEAEKDDFHFVCATCRRREAAKEEARKRELAKPKIVIKLKGSSSSPPQPQRQAAQLNSSGHVVVEIPSRNVTTTPGQSNGTAAYQNGYSGLSSGPVLDPSARLPPSGIFKTNAIPTKTSILATQPVTANGTSFPNPFSSSPPNLAHPGQSPNKARAYGTIGVSQPGSSPIRPGGDGPVQLSPWNYPFAQPPASSGQQGKQNSAPSPKKAQPQSAPRPSNAAVSTTPIPIPRFPAPAKPDPVTATTAEASTLPVPKLSPQLAHPEQPQPSNESSSPLLPPSTAGRSPQKHSSPMLPPAMHAPIQTPALVQTNVNGNEAAHKIASSPTPVVLPPAPTLSPSLRQQNLTPPVKHAEPVRATSGSLPTVPQ